MKRLRDAIEQLNRSRETSEQIQGYRRSHFFFICMLKGKIDILSHGDIKNLLTGCKDREIILEHHVLKLIILGRFAALRQEDFSAASEGFKIL